MAAGSGADTLREAAQTVGADRIPHRRGPRQPGRLGSVEDPGGGANGLDRLIAGLGARLFGLYCATLRFEVEGEDRLRQHLAQGGRIIFASWHQRILAGVWYLRRYDAVVMISQSRDGERMRRIAEGVGWRVVSGSSSRGGVRALLEQVRAVREGAVGGHVVDGPRGPARVVKPGLLLLAARSGAAIAPLIISVRWRIEVGSWDRMHIPLPLSRVRIRFLEPIEVAPKLSQEETEALRVRIEALFETESRELDLRTRGSPDRDRNPRV